MKSFLDCLEIISRLVKIHISILKLGKLMEKLRSAVFGNLPAAGTLPMKGDLRRTHRSKEAGVWLVKADVAQVGSV